MPTITKYIDVEVEVDVDLDDYTDAELQDECLARNIWPNQTTDSTNAAIHDLYDAYVRGQDITNQLRKLFDIELGRIV